MAHFLACDYYNILYNSTCVLKCITPTLKGLFDLAGGPLMTYQKLNFILDTSVIAHFVARYLCKKIMISKHFS